MRENKLSILIEKPVERVFEFTTNPKNTHVWIDSIEEEIINTEEIQIGTLYKNRGNDNQWDIYEVTNFIKNKLFVLKSRDSSYVVEYSYEKIDQNSCMMTYYEFMEDNELPNPFELKTLELLKEIIEKN